MLPKNALVKAKKAVDGLMNLKCDIYEYSEITEDSITRHKRQIVHSNVPCRISYATRHITVYYLSFVPWRKIQTVFHYREQL